MQALWDLDSGLSRISIFFLFAQDILSCDQKNYRRKLTIFTFTLYTNYEHGWRPFKSLLLLGSFPLLAILPVFLQLTGVPSFVVVDVSAIAGVHGGSVRPYWCWYSCYFGRPACGFAIAGVSAIAGVHGGSVRPCWCWHSCYFGRPACGFAIAGVSVITSVCGSSVCRCGCWHKWHSCYC
jgi:hypothetical protein